MPLKGKPQPTDDERKLILTWTRGMLDAEARARRATLAACRCAG